MTKQDLQGREYASYSSLKAGQLVKVDDGFDCMTPWSARPVHFDNSGKAYLLCDAGYHYLDGRHDSIIGIYPIS